MKNFLRNISYTLIMLALATGLAFLFFHFGQDNTANIAFVYILALILIARWTTGYLYGILSSLFCVVFINGCFTYPFFEINFTMSGYPVTFVCMLIITITTSAMTTKLTRQDEMIAENAAMAVVYSGEAGLALEYNDKLAFSVPEEGSNMWIDCWLIPKRARHTENAEKFLNFLCRKDIAMQNFDYVYYATPNVKVKEALDPELQENSTIFPPPEILENCEVLKSLDDEATMKYNLYWKEIKSAD